MKKDIPYREQLLELSKLYKVPEVKSYIKSKKNLTTSQLELILLKNKIPLPAQSYSRKLQKNYGNKCNKRTERYTAHLIF